MYKCKKLVKVDNKWIDLNKVNLRKIAKLALQFSGKEASEQKINDFIKEF